MYTRRTASSLSPPHTEPIISSCCLFRLAICYWPSVFTLNEIIYPEVEDEPDEDDIEEDIQAEVVSPTITVATGESIPSADKAYLPFLNYLNDRKVHTRKESLQWFSSTFDISLDDQKLTYENGNRRWETVLDAIITLFRRHGLLMNSEKGSFHLTEIGYNFAEVVKRRVGLKSMIMRNLNV